MIRRLLLIFSLAVLTSPAFAGAWDDVDDAVSRAVRSHDVLDWARALLNLERHDHAAAARALVRLWAEQRAYDGEWGSGGAQSSHGGFLREDPRAFYGRRLARRSDPRAVRVLAELVTGTDPDAADLAATALTDHPRLHLVFGELCEAYRRALIEDDAPAVARLLPILGGRLAVTDRAWVRLSVLDERSAPVARVALLLAYPDFGLWREVLEADGKKGLFPEGELAAALDERLGGPAGAAIVEILDGAARIETAIADLPAGVGPDALAEAVGGLGLAHPRESLAEARRRAIQAATGTKGLLQLRKVHELAVRVALARAWNRDRLLFGSATKEPFDKTLNTARAAARSPVVDFAREEADALVRRAAELGGLLRALMGDRPDPVVGPPYDARFFERNAGRTGGIDEVAFGPLETEAIRIRESVDVANRSHPAVSDIERENVRLVNVYRHEHGLLPVRLDADLVRSARAHTRFQHARGQIAHVFDSVREPEGRTPKERMAHAGYPPSHAGRENVLVGTQDPAAAFDWWRNSPGHRSAMLEPRFTEIGVAEHAGYWTQNYGSEPYGEDHHAKDD